MLLIRSKWGALIEQVLGIRGSSLGNVSRTPDPQPRIPAAFLAALIANESGGDPATTRFEPGVFKKFIQTQQDGAERGSPLAQEDLQELDAARLKAAATSFGLTQIMGWHVLNSEFKILNSELADPAGLLDPAFNLKAALQVLGKFCAAYDLDPGRDFAELFRCWNTGRPYGVTHDPEYVPKGLARMEIYKKLSAISNQPMR